MGERAAVPFEEQAPFANDDHGVGGAVAILVVDQLVDELVERGRRAAHRPAIRVGRRPRHTTRLRRQRHEDVVGHEVSILAGGAATKKR